MVSVGPFCVPGYYVGDCRDLLAKLPDESINCVVTSPPYWGLRSYLPEGHADKSLELGSESTYVEYVDHMVSVFREIRRVLKGDGTLWLNLGDCYATGAGAVGECPGGGKQGERWRGYRGERLANGRGDSDAILRVKTVGAIGPMTQPNRMHQPGLKAKDLVGIPWRVAFALQADGWYLRKDIVWAKPNPMPESVQDRPTTAHEFLFLMSKSERYHYDAEAIREPQVAPESSTPDDRARAFSRRRQTVADPRQEGLTADDLLCAAIKTLARKRSGNKERTYSDGNGKRPSDHLASGVPWQDTDGKRNKRSVWTVATEPTPDAHFATFPRKLVEPCILAGCPGGGRRA